MHVAEQSEVHAKPQSEPQKRTAKYPRLFGDNDAVHVLVVATLTAFTVSVVSRAFNFADATTLALVVFFVMSIAGGVLGGCQSYDGRAADTPEVAAQPETTALKPKVVDRNPRELEPQPQM